MKKKNSNDSSVSMTPRRFCTCKYLIEIETICENTLALEEREQLDQSYGKMWVKNLVKLYQNVQDRVFATRTYAQNLKPYYGSLTGTDQIVEESCGLISAIGWSDFLKELNHSTLLCNTLLSFSITFPSCRFFKKVLYHSFYAHLTQKL